MATGKFNFACVILPSAGVVDIPVRFAPLIAGKSPVNLDAVKAEIRASATVPVKLPAGMLVKLAALFAGNVAGNLASGTVPDVRLLALKAVRSFAVLAAIDVLIALATLSAVTASSLTPSVDTFVNAIV